MSLLTVTMIGAAFFGADPEAIGSYAHSTSVSQEAEVISQDYIAGESVPCQQAAPVQCQGECHYSYGESSRCKHCWCPWCDCHDDDCEESRCDRHLQTYCIGPGDFYPHYPYCPVYHGYYYFRPYNHMHVQEAAALAAQMGGDPRAPYSVEFLKSYFPPAPVESPIVPQEEQYPLLENLLEPKMPME